MPNHTREIDILYPRAVDMKFVLVREAADELGYAALRAMSFINEGRNDCDATAGHDCRR
jgi:hypothetical protein